MSEPHPAEDLDQDGAGSVAFMEEMHNSFTAATESMAQIGSDPTTALTQDGSTVPDIMLLNVLCARAKPPKDTEESRMEAQMSWQPVREWLGQHDAEAVRMAAEQRGESGLTALHFACRNVPPLDVIDVFLSIASDTVQWPDSFGWLPIHYACASGSDSSVIHALADAYPESKTTTDRRGRTPLHFALGDKPASPDVIVLLSSSGAAAYPDEIGMLPLHYACAFGASEDILFALTDAYPEAIRARDSRKRTPLHFALSNAGRKTVPAAVRLLLNIDSSIVNSMDKGPLPLRVLAQYAQMVKNEKEDRDEKRESVVRCLEHLLNAEPEPTADFFTALQSLPDWLNQRAVVMKVVQNLLNEKISQRFPTAVLLLDFVFLALVIGFYSRSVAKSLNRRFDDIEGDDSLEFGYVLPLYMGGGYFALRELIQIISLVSLKVFKLWLYDPSNYLNVAFVAIVWGWSIIMHSGAGDRDTFRVGSAISVIILWVKLLAYLRNILLDFAVFIRGVLYVIRRLLAFLVSLGIILLAFAQMFYTVFQQTDACKSDSSDPDYDIVLEQVRCDASTLEPYCTYGNSFLSVYTMLLGEVDDTQFKGSRVGTTLFIIFMFLVVILLANVLIAIVTDSYRVIQDQQAAVVFWTNRLDFVAEMDAIANGPFWRLCGFKKKEAYLESARQQATFGKEAWKQIMDLYEDELEDGLVTFDFWAYTFLRVVAAILIPLWVLVGALTFGWLWPPQVREAVFASTVFASTTDIAKEDEQRRSQIVSLQQEVAEFKENILQELAMDRTHVMQLRSQVAESKADIVHEMRDIKRLVALLFERQADM